MPPLCVQEENFKSYGDYFKLRLLPWTWLTGWWNKPEEVDLLVEAVADTRSSGFSLQIYKWRFEFVARRRP